MCVSFLTKSIAILALTSVSGAAIAATAEQPGGKLPVIVEPMSMGSLVQVTLGLVAVLLLLWGFAWLMRRVARVQSGAGGHLRVLGGLSLGARERVMLVQAGETQLLLGVAPGRVNTLHVLDTPLPTDSAAGPGAFADSLRTVLGKGKAS